MDRSQVNAGIFPTLNDGVDGDVRIAMQEIPSVLLKEIDSFCSDNGMEVPYFFQTIWSIVVRPYTETDRLCFGFEDLRESQLEPAQDAIQVVQTSVLPDLPLGGLLKNQDNQTIVLLPHGTASAHNTALFLKRESAQWDVISWLDKSGTFYEVILLVDFDCNSSSPTQLRLLHHTSILSNRQAQNVASTVSQAIEEILAHPNRLVKDLDLFSRRNQEHVSLWNNRTRVKSIKPSVIDLITEHATKRPHEIAISAWDGELTYAQLDAVTSKLAIYLQSLGVGPEVMVPLTVAKSTWAIVAELSILKAGGAFVPMDPLQPLDRLKYIVQQANATIALASEQFVDRLASLVDKVVVVSDQTVSCLPEVGHDLPSIAADSAAYVLFTSGSTGQPKGCVVENGALADVFYHAQALKINPQSRVLQFASYSFGVSLIEIYCTLTMGATMCIPSDDDRLNRLTQVMTEMKISWAFLTPSTANSIDSAKCPKDLKTLVLAGEAMGNQHFRAWSDKVELLQGFGFTEWAGVCCVSHPIVSQNDLKTIGTSATANLWLADPMDHNKLSPVGAVAELLVEGPSLARGYLNNSSKTASSFIVSPDWLRSMRPAGYGRVYKTGDLVQYQSDGTLRYIARKDTQVKIRGKRLELGEVEHQVRRACPTVDRVIAEATVPAIGNGVPILVAFLYSNEHYSATNSGTRESGSSLFGIGTERFRSDVADIKKALETILPDHMRPSVYVPLKSIPLTITGKVDRRALRETVRTLTREELEAYQSTKSEVVAPVTDVEKRLHEMFAQILNLAPERFGTHDSFIRLGGDSIMAMRLANLCREEKYPLKVAAILEHETIAKLAGLVMDKRDVQASSINGGRGSSLVSARQLSGGPFPYLDLSNTELDDFVNQRLVTLGVSLNEVEDAYPCSPIQEGILLSQVRNPAQYQMRFVWEISPIDDFKAVDVKRVQSAWRRVCLRHPLLRTQFCENVTANAFAVQVVLKDGIEEMTVIQDDNLDPQDLFTREEAKRRSGQAAVPQATLFKGSQSQVYAVLNISHTLIDAMSMSIMMRDLAILYDDEANGENGSHLLTTPCNYRDYVTYLANQNNKSGLDFWKSYLGGFDPCLFPCLNAGATSTAPQRLMSVPVNLGDLSRYHKFCQERGITLANIFKMAWGLVLRCFTSSDNVCFGYMTAGRDAPLAGLNDAVGPFINMLICRIDFSKDASLLQTLQGIQSDFIQSIEHQNVSLAEVRHSLGLADDAMFNTSMTFPPQAPRGRSKPTSITVSEMDRLDPTEYDIVVEVGVQDRDVQCTMKYWPQFLSNEQARHLANTLSLALSQIVEHAQKAVAQVDLFSSGDEARVAEWNKQRPEALESRVHELIRQRCQDQPDAPAVDAWDGRWTYRELDELSSGLAQHLQAKGVGPEVFVPLCFAKGRWTPIAILAVIKAGGAFVLLDPSHPVERLQEMCAQLHAPVVLASQQQADLAGQLNSNVLVVGDNITAWSKSHVQVSSSVKPHNALYVVFTSGSTGTPKGVVVEHQSFSASARAAGYISHLQADDRVFQFSSYAFDVSVIDQLTSMLTGACLCIPSDIDRQNNLMGTMNDLQVTWALVTPSVARLLQPTQLHSLRTLVLAGEPTLASDIETWASQVRLINMYGPAECAVVVTSRRCVSPVSDVGIIGAALRSVATWVVDPEDHERLVPVGAVGELVIEGPGVSRGYLHNHGALVPPFLRPPHWLSRFRGQSNSRLYKTGDLVQYTAEGALRYLGRKDTQVKIRGQRVELNEIESAIRTFFSGTRDAIVEVVALGGESARAALVAYIQSANDLTPNERTNGASPEGSLFGEPDENFLSEVTALSAQLHSALPKYMVPAIYLPVKQIPLTKTGKTDRKLLRQTVAALSSDQVEVFSISHAAQKPPTTEMELTLQALLAEVLSLPKEKIWADSHFFLLGGDSIVAMKLVTAARKAGLRLTVADIFNNPQLSDLAMTFQGASNLASEKVAPFSLLATDQTRRLHETAAGQCGLSSEQIEDVYPCTAMQEGLMALTARKAGMYTAQLLYQLPAGIDIDRFRAAWQATVDASVILRTRIFQTESEGSFQAVVRARDSTIEWLHGDSVQAYLEQDAANPMRLGKSLARFALIREAQHAHASHLVLTFHHAVYDGVSIPLILDQVESAYRGQALVDRPFNHFVKHIVGQDPEEVKKFWVSTFDGLTAPIFPPLRAGIRTPAPSSLIKHEIPISQHQGRAGVTLSNMIRLAWAIVVSQYTDSSDVVFGVTVTGRNAPVTNIDQLTGPTITSVPFRIQVNGDVPIHEALAAIQNHATRMIPFEQTGLQHIRGMSREAASACDFQSHIGVQLPQETTSASDLMVSQNSYSDYTAFASYAFVLICNLPSTPNEPVSVSANFDPRVLLPDEAECLVAQFGHVLQQVCTQPDRQVRDIEAFSPRDLNQLQKWNGQLPATHNHTIHQLVLRHSAEKPKDLALISWDRQLTFQELDSLSSRLAQQLIALGLRPGDPVPLCFEKSTWPVVTMMAVLRAGGTCVNIDPALPAGRIQQMLQETQPALILASAAKKQLMADSAPASATIHTVPLDSTVSQTTVNGWTAPTVETDSPAFILFTSGSTGTPKGIVMEHRNLATSIFHHSGPLGLTPKTRALQFAAYAFDSSIYETFSTLVIGGCVCIPSEDQRMSNLAGYIRDHNIDWAVLTPSTASIIHPSEVPSLRTLVLGGEAVTQANVSRWASKVRLINGYGPAEATICAAGQIPSDGWRAGTIGPILGAVGWVTVPSDPSRLAPLGAVGELLLEGPVVTRGYLNQPEKTRNAYIAPPAWLSRFRGGNPGRLYRSGDLVQFTSDGWIRFVGRKDTQVKLRGQRIELGEIEFHVRTHFPGAIEVAAEVVKRGQDETESSLLLAFVCCNEKGASTADLENIIAPPDKDFQSKAWSVREKLKESLPPYMVPAALLPLTYIPLSKTGKTDRRLLRDAAIALTPQQFEAYADSGMGTEHKQPPVTNEEKILQHLWARVLGVPAHKIGRDDHFFHVGGESIAAMKLVGAARHEGYELSVAQVFDQPRLSSMATLLAAAGSEKSPEHAPAPFSLVGDSGAQERLMNVAGQQCQVSLEQIEDIYPCTPLQEGLMALTAKAPERYIATSVYNLPADVDVHRFVRAWDEAAKAHPILRTRIIQDDLQGSFQVVVRETLSWEKHEASTPEALSNLSARVALGTPLLRLSLVYANASSMPSSCVISLHHAVHDRWSTPVLLSEVERAYRGLSLERQPFSPFIAYLSESRSSAAEFWKKELADLEAVPFPMLPSASYSPNPTSTMVRRISLPQAAGPVDATLATKVKLAWALLVSQYTCTKDVVFGLTTSGRGSPVKGIEQQVGPTITTSPTRIHINPAEQALDVLRAVQQKSLRVMPYEHMGLQNISRMGPSEASACRFQTLMVIQPDQKVSQSTFFTKERILSGLEQYSSYALMLLCGLSSNGVEITAIFDDRVLERIQMERVLRQFEHLIAQFNQNLTGKTIADLETVSEWDRSELDRWNRLPEQVADDPCLHDLVVRRCQIQPDAPAVSAWDGNLTYQQLDRYSSRLAVYLQSQGVQPDTFVPLLFEKSRVTVVAQLAVLKAGGAFVLLDPSHPLTRLQEICGDLKAPLLLASDTQCKTASELSSRTVSLGNNLEEQFIENEGIHAISRVTPSNALYAVFTSGSTGKPKGCVIEHRSLCASMTSLIQTTDMDPSARVLQFAGYSFDISIMDHFMTLLAGGCICIPSEFDRRNHLAKVMTQLQVNWACLTSSVIRSLSPEDTPTLKTLMQAGEPMTRDNVDIWSKCTRLMNGYGPAECAVISSAQVIFDDNAEASDIGRAIGGVCWVLHPEDPEKLLPIGSIGELVIEGEHVGRGYLNDPEKTSAAFIRYPSWLRQFEGRQTDGGCLYKTGDLVRYAPDGTLRYIGRKDSQVKLRGQRIELLEVEHHVRNCFPGAGDLVVDVVKPSDGRQPVLVAFIALGLGRTSSHDGHSEQIFRSASRDFLDTVKLAETQLHDRLPAYMVPAFFISLSQMPLTKSGKADRRRVTALAAALSRDVLQSYSPTQAPKAAPATELEQKVRQIWARVLRLTPEDIGVHDSFFHIGGDSITSMQVAMQCKSMGLQVTVADIFQHKSIKGLATHCPLAETTTVSQKDEIYAWRELSPIQQHFFNTSPNEYNHFNQAFLLRLGRRVDAKSVSNAIRSIVQTHTMLRARFKRSPTGVWTQAVTDDLENSFRFHEHRINSREAIPGISEKSNKSLNIQTGPLFVADLIQVTETGQQYLFLVAHHLVVDIVSWWVILADLEDLLNSGSIVGSRPMPFLAWCWEQARHAAQNLPPHVALPVEIPPPVDIQGYWEMQDRPNTVGDAEMYEFSLDKETTQTLLGAANGALGTQPVEIIQAALVHAFVQTFRDRQAPTVFVEGHGREPWDKTIDLTRTVGWFTTIWPTYMALEPSNSIAEAVRRTKDSRRRVPSNGWAYFASRYLNSDGRKAFDHAGPMEIVFNYAGVMQQVDAPDTLLQFEHLDVRGVTGKGVQRFALIDINAMVTGGCLQVFVGVNRHMKSQPALRQWIDKCQISLREAAEHLTAMQPSYTLSDFSLLSLTYDRLDHLIKDIMPQCGPIEDIYPCTPVQRGMVLSQLRNPDYYFDRYIMEVIPADGQPPIDVQRLKQAWLQVVSRHAALRTILVPVSQQGFSDQIVLRNFTPDVQIVSSSTSDVLVQNTNGQTVQHAFKPTHEMVIRQGPNGQVLLDFSISHVFMDGTSLQLLRRDLVLAYEGRLSMVDPPLYKDFVSYLQTVPGAPAKEYWHRYLDGVEPCHIPPVPESVSKDREGSIGGYQLELGPSSALDAFSSKHGVTLTSVLHVAWALVLRCFTAMDSVCFGYVTSGREQPVAGIQDAIGPFINMLVSRIDMSGEESLLSVLSSHHDHFLQNLAHQNCSLADMQNSANTAGEALFNTIVSIQKEIPGQPTQESSISMKMVDGQEKTEYPIALSIIVAGGKVELLISYWPTFISDAQAATIAQCVRQALTEILQNPTQKIGQVDLLPDESFSQISSWNQRALDDVNECVHSLIHRRVVERPDAPAICAWDGSMTYQELDTRSSILAAELMRHGVGPEVFVPLCFEKSQWVPVAALAVIKAGGAFALLDVSLPRARLQGMCNDLQATLVITSSQNVELATTLAPQQIVVGAQCSLWQQKADPVQVCNVPNPSVVPDNAVYAVFTSGSTGKPKGAVVEHRTFCSSRAGQESFTKISPDSRILQFSSHAFDVAPNDILTAFVAGACICIPSETDRISRLTAAATELQVTRAVWTPSLARSIRPSDIPTLKTVMVGGEAPTETEIALWSSIEMILVYGPAECGMFSAARPSVPQNQDITSIGKATSSARLWVVDQRDHTKLLPVGAVGDLIIEGPNVTRHYIGDAEKTRRSYVEPPAWRSRFDIPGVYRMFRTGDLVRYQPDGSLCYVGRRDTQVKLRGQRIELREVEHHLENAFPGVQHVVADVITPSEGRRAPALMAFVLQSGADCNTDRGSAANQPPSDNIFLPPSEQFRRDVRTALPELRSAMPAFMVPMIFLPLATLPMTTTGKTDRRFLRTRAAALASTTIESYSVTQATMRAPTTPMEAKLHTLAAQVLNVSPDNLGVDNDVFQNGLDSIGAMRLVSLARQEGLQLSVPNVFDHPRISDLARVVQQVGHGEQDRAIDGGPGSLLHGSDYEQVARQIAADHSFNTSDIVDILPTTEFQRDYVLGSQHAYFMLHLDGHLDPSPLLAAAQAVVEKYSILRTVFVPFQKTMVQVVLRHVDVPLLELSTDDSDLPAAAESICEQDATPPVPFGSPYFQLSLIRGDSRSILALRFSHAQYDGLSIPHVFRDLAAAYSHSKLEPAPNFADFMAQRARNNSPALFKFWEELLYGSSMTYLDSSALNGRDSNGPETTLELKRTIAVPNIPPGITVATVHKAAWSLVLARQTKSQDLVFGQVVNGRNMAMNGIEDVVGPCVTIIPVRVTLQSISTVQDLLRQVQNQHTRTMEYETADLSDIVAQSTPWPRGTSFGSITQHQNIALSSKVSLGGLMGSSTGHQYNYIPKTPYVVSFPAENNRLDMLLWASSRSLGSDAAHRLLKEFCEVFVELLANPERMVKDMV